MKKTSNNIKQIDITQIAKDLRIEQYSEELLAIKSDTAVIQNILNKPFRSPHYAILMVPRGKAKIRVNMFEYELAKLNVLAVSASAIKEFISVEDNTQIYSLLYTQDYIL